MTTDIPHHCHPRPVSFLTFSDTLYDVYDAWHATERASTPNANRQSPSCLRVQAQGRGIRSRVLGENRSQTTTTHGIPNPSFGSVNRGGPEWN